ncbi:DUF2505 domain-containing protein [Ornithinimicrobium pratense]|nr:DUF2505 domain-containing protein [Ornithinimicrobium pratense]
MRITETVIHAADPLRTYEMLTDHDYQVARCERTGATDQTVTIDREPEGTTTVTTQRHIPSDGVPDFAKAFVGPTLLLVETVRWGAPDADGEREGAMSLELPGIPVSFTGGMHLRRGGAPGQTEHTVDGDLDARIPLLGRRIEAMVSEQVGRMIQEERQLAEEWLRDHPGAPA